VLLKKIFRVFFGGFWVSRSIGDDEPVVEDEVKEPSLREVADMVYLVFLAVKELEVKVDGLKRVTGL
jgi:hypothetical protein